MKAISVFLLAVVLLGCESKSTTPKVVAQPAPKLIPHTKVLDNELLQIKASWIVRVPLVREDGKERLPTKEELGAISTSLKKNHERTFVLFYLPGMKEGAGAFATAHHNPTMEVEIQEFMIPERFKHLINSQ